jgi:hypothetical protein
VRISAATPGFFAAVRYEIGAGAVRLDDDPDIAIDDIAAQMAGSGKQLRPVMQGDDCRINSDITAAVAGSKCHGRRAVAQGTELVNLVGVSPPYAWFGR